MERGLGDSKPKIFHKIFMLMYESTKRGPFRLGELTTENGLFAVFFFFGLNVNVVKSLKCSIYDAVFLLTMLLLFDSVMMFVIRSQKEKKTQRHHGEWNQPNFWKYHLHNINMATNIHTDIHAYMYVYVHTYLKCTIKRA